MIMQNVTAWTTVSARFVLEAVADYLATHDDKH
jgi:hypothetical protein